MSDVCLSSFPPAFIVVAFLPLHKTGARSLNTSYSVNGKKVFYVSDSSSYVTVGQNFLRFREFTREGPEQPSAFRTPVYPLILAGLILAFAHSFEIAAIVLQIGFGVITAVGVYLIAREISSGPYALLVGCAYALFLGPLIYTYLIMSEKLFSLLIVIFCLFCLKAMRQPMKWRWIMLSAIALGVATLTRPIAYYLFLLWALLVFYSLWPDLRGAASRVAVFVLVFFLVLSPWLIRNQVSLGYPGISTLDGENLWFYNYGTLEAFRSGRTLVDVKAELKSVDPAESLGGMITCSFERSTQLRNRAIRAILEDPVTYARVHMKGMFVIVASYPVQELRQLLDIPYQNDRVFGNVEHPSLAELLERVIAAIPGKLDVVSVFLFQHLPMTTLAIFGTIGLLRRKHLRSAGLLLMGTAFYLVLVPGVMPFARYLVPATGPLCALAAPGLEYLFGAACGVCEDTHMFAPHLSGKA